MLGKTYMTFDEPAARSRTVWAYVARNLSRPLAPLSARRLGQRGGRQSAVGRFSPHERGLAETVSELASEERVYVGGKFATQNDLAALFTVRAARSLFALRRAHRLRAAACGALTRAIRDNCGKGSFSSARIAWDEAWTMDDDVQPLFPVPSCVAFGRRRATAKALPEKVRAYSGQLPMRDASEVQAEEV